MIHPIPIPEVTSANNEAATTHAPYVNNMCTAVLRLIHIPAILQTKTMVPIPKKGIKHLQPIILMNHPDDYTEKNIGFWKPRIISR
jgi:hypothetical protein